MAATGSWRRRRASLRACTSVRTCFLMRIHFFHDFSAVVHDFHNCSFGRRGGWQPRGDDVELRFARAHASACAFGMVVWRLWASSWHSEGSLKSDLSTSVGLANFLSADLRIHAEHWVTFCVLGSRKVHYAVGRNRGKALFSQILSPPFSFFDNRQKGRRCDAMSACPECSSIQF